MSEWTAQACLSHGSTKQIANIQWNGKLKKGDYVSFNDIPYQYMNGPKRLWKVDEIYRKEPIPQWDVIFARSEGFK